VQMMCDLAHLDAMFVRFERSVGRAFSFVTWIRLDVVWETELESPLPLPAPHNSAYHSTVWLPNMNSQRGGMCDKYAFGGRRAMAYYLNRVDLVGLNYSSIPRGRGGESASWRCHQHDESNKQLCAVRPIVNVADQCKKRSGCMLSLSSEKFLNFALHRANLTVVRMKSWNFCKFGDQAMAWPGCTARLRAHVSCRSLTCPSWMPGGCTCANTTCPAKSWYCTNVDH